MNVLLEPSIFVNKVIGQQKKSDTNYRKLRYIIKTENEHGVLLYNFLTLELIFLSFEEYSKYMSQTDTILTEFYIANWFYVPQDFDEFNVYNQIISVAKMIDYKMDYRHYTIFPTLDCNARCFYCFENGKKRESMTMETADLVADYIVKNHINTMNQIRWFGGEPLCNISVIDAICEKLFANNIPFSSSIVSNMYLFNDENIDKAKKLWNLTYAHTTLDGTQEVYNKTKAYIYKEDKNPFATVINNIHNLLDNDIRVKVRMQVNATNYNDLNNLIDFLADEFAGEQRFSMYTALLYKSDLSSYDVGSDNSFNNQMIYATKLRNKIFEKGFFEQQLNRDIKPNVCGADSKSSYVILPNGNFTPCTNYCDETKLGSVRGSTIDYELLNSWGIEKEKDENCKICPLLPGCRNLKKCKGGVHDECSAEYRQIIREINTLSMKQAYIDYYKK